MTGETLLIIVCIVFVAAVCYWSGYVSGWKALGEKLKKDALSSSSGALAAAATEMRAQIAAQATSMPAAGGAPPVPIGERFDYIGLQMICVAHAVRMPMGMLGPGLSAEYRDRDGIVRGHYWTPDQFDAIRAEIKRTAASLQQPRT